MQTVIKLCINGILGKVRLTRINQRGLNHLPAVVYVKINPALYKYAFFCYHLVADYLGAIDSVARWLWKDLLAGVRENPRSKAASRAAFLHPLL